MPDEKRPPNQDGDPCPKCQQPMDRDIYLRWDRCRKCHYFQDFTTKQAISQRIDVPGIIKPTRRQL